MPGSAEVTVKFDVAWVEMDDGRPAALVTVAPGHPKELISVVDPYAPTPDGEGGEAWK